MIYESEVQQDVRGYYSFKHAWDITRQLSLTADVNGVSDNSFLRDYSVPLQTRGTQYVPSNVFLSQRWPTFNLTGNTFWYRDLTQRSPVALQRLPQIFFNGAPQPVPGLPGFLYQFDTSAVNFVRDVGSEGGRLALQPLVSRPIRIADVITVTPFAGGIVTGYTTTVTGLSPGPGKGIVLEDTNGEPLLRGLGVLGGDIEARASRIYRAGFLGFDAFMHVIEPRVNYTFIGGQGLEGVPQWTELDRIDKTNRISYSFINRLFAKTPAPTGTEAAKLEVVRVTLGQSYDLLRNDNRFSSLFGELILNPSSFVYFRGDATYDVYGGGLTDSHCQPRAGVAPAGGRLHRDDLRQECQGELRARLGERRHHPLRDRAVSDELEHRVRRLRGEPVRARHQVSMLGSRPRVHHPLPEQQRVSLHPEPAGGRWIWLGHRPWHDLGQRLGYRLGYRLGSVLMIPLVDLARQHAELKDQLLAAMERVLDSTRFILGREGEALEAEVATFCGVRHAIGVASGTDALRVTLAALGVGPGAEVITPAFSFIASSSTILMAGATPVFADIVPDLFALDPHAVERAITPRTKVIMPVHLYGHPAAMDDLMRIARRHGLAVIEDAAQAIGASWGGRPVGAWAMPPACPSIPPRTWAPAAMQA